jgi:hypothetical protein
MIPHCPRLQITHRGEQPELPLCQRRIAPRPLTRARRLPCRPGRPLPSRTPGSVPYTICAVLSTRASKHGARGRRPVNARSAAFMPRSATLCVVYGLCGPHSPSTCNPPRRGASGLQGRQGRQGQGANMAPQQAANTRAQCVRWHAAVLRAATVQRAQAPLHLVKGATLYSGLVAESACSGCDSVPAQLSAAKAHPFRLQPIQDPARSHADASGA